MNKAELVEAIAKESGASKAKVEAGLKAAIGVISKELKKGGTVQLIGFGTFSVKNRAARTGVNPATGAKIKIKASKVPAFKAGAGLKGVVSGKKKVAPAAKAAPKKKAAAKPKAAPKKKAAAKVAPKAKAAPKKKKK